MEEHFHTERKQINKTEKKNQKVDAVDEEIKKQNCQILADAESQTAASICLRSKWVG